MKNEKWTFINVQFQKSQNTFEKTLHHSLIQRPPAAVCDLVGHYIMLSFLFERVVTCRPLCSGDVGRVKVRIKGSTDGEAVFANSWLWGFGG